MKLNHSALSSIMSMGRLGILEADIAYQAKQPMVCFARSSWRAFYVRYLRRVASSEADPPCFKGRPQNK